MTTGDIVQRKYAKVAMLGTVTAIDKRYVWVRWDGATEAKRILRDKVVVVRRVA